MTFAAMNCVSRSELLKSPERKVSSDLRVLDYLYVIFALMTQLKKETVRKALAMHESLHCNGFPSAELKTRFT